MGGCEARERQGEQHRTCYSAKVAARGVVTVVEVRAAAAERAGWVAAGWVAAASEAAAVTAAVGRAAETEAEGLEAANLTSSGALGLFCFSSSSLDGGDGEGKAEGVGRGRWCGGGDETDGCSEGGEGCGGGERREGRRRRRAWRQWRVRQRRRGWRHRAAAGQRAQCLFHAASKPTPLTRGMR